mmetsp:Transcript_4835/g.12393  ORF Transcript_4835/g.12393 Transcript_4835/m.12393 type:complete len:206 (+) Transcript_4835:95-712(+)
MYSRRHWHVAQLIAGKHALSEHAPGPLLPLKSVRGLKMAQRSLSALAAHTDSVKADSIGARMTSAIVSRYQSAAPLACTARISSALRLSARGRWCVCAIAAEPSNASSLTGHVSPSGLELPAGRPPGPAPPAASSLSAPGCEAKRWRAGESVASTTAVYPARTRRDPAPPTLAVASAAATAARMRAAQRSQPVSGVASARWLTGH